jgi:hypothetical protein
MTYFVATFCFLNVLISAFNAMNTFVAWSGVCGWLTALLLTNICQQMEFRIKRQSVLLIQGKTALDESIEFLKDTDACLADAQESIKALLGAGK